MGRHVSHKVRFRGENHAAMDTKVWTATIYHAGYGTKQGKEGDVDVGHSLQILSGVSSNNQKNIKSISDGDIYIECIICN
mmetsp:Transcript_13415/g.19192  ORF Transcript_13415/g.19192 Transcript_13415/m.19192 type:complete len:80 (+) Transcript_13415:1080-1319(+)